MVPAREFVPAGRRLIRGRTSAPTRVEERVATNRVPARAANVWPARLSEKVSASLKAQSALASSPFRYQLAPHIRLCRADDYAVLLDLKSGEYLGLRFEDAACLSYAVEELSDLQNECPIGSNDSTDELIEELFRHHIIESRTSEKVAEQSPYPRPVCSLIQGYEVIRYRPRVRDWVNLCTAVMIAATLMRFASFETIIGRFTRHCAEKGRKPKTEWLRERIALFRDLSPLFFTPADACLLSSLALAEFLARDRVYVTLVFGVSSSPFSAHCWLQYEDIALNDEPGYLCQYTPIFVVKPGQAKRPLT
jgi:Transglutaminase-like superfamily